MKVGANRSEQNKILKLATPKDQGGAGMSPAEISKAMNINVKTCEAFSKPKSEKKK